MHEVGQDRRSSDQCFREYFFQLKLSAAWLSQCLFIGFAHNGIVSPSGGQGCLQQHCKMMSLKPDPSVMRMLEKGIEDTQRSP